MPAVTTAPRSAPDAATPRMRLAVETRPSVAPSTAARNQLVRPVACCSRCDGRMTMGPNGSAPNCEHPVKNPPD